jgi:hypothetical protein
MTTIDEAQIINYLKATGMRVRVVINFGKESLERKRKNFGPNQPKISEIREISG